MRLSTSPQAEGQKHHQTHFAVIEKSSQWRKIEENTKGIQTRHQELVACSPLSSLAVPFRKHALDEMFLRLAALVCSSERNRPQTTFLFPFPLRIKYHVFCYHPQLKEEGENICVLSQVPILGAGRSLWAFLDMFLRTFCISSGSSWVACFHTEGLSPEGRGGHFACLRRGRVHLLLTTASLQQLWLEDGIETYFLWG